MAKGNNVCRCGKVFKTRLDKNRHIKEEHNANQMARVKRLPDRDGKRHLKTGPKRTFDLAE